ncbi:EMC9 protein, partial [Atractosteus spatula]|nr:EMC9 protein [Atractosteus spatula]
MVEVELSCLSYVKMFLHACRYPHCAVNGLLLSSSPAEGAMCVSDCIPLLHSGLSLSAMTEVALNQVDVWCAQNQQRIVGYYQANASVSDNSPTPCAVKIADKIAEQCSSAVLVMVENSKVSAEYGAPPIVVYEKRDARWTLKDKHQIMLRQWEQTRAVAEELRADRAQALLVDFDSHLDDLRRDWTNPELNARIAELRAPAGAGL